MAEKLKKIWDDDNTDDEARPGEAALRPDGNNPLTHQLSRTFTQPRAMLDAIGPMTLPDDLEDDDAAIDEAYYRMQLNVSSGILTHNSHEDGQEIHHDRVQEREGGHEARGDADNLGESSTTGSRNEAKSSLVEAWPKVALAKSILSRPTGWGFAQRNQVTKYRTHLETSIAQLKVEVSSLSSELALLEQHISFLRTENDALNRKIRDLAQSEILQEENSALEREIHQLRMQADGTEQAQQNQQDIGLADDTEQAEQEQDLKRAGDREHAEQELQDTVLSSIPRLSLGHGDDEEARAHLPTVQGHSSDQIRVPDTQTREELEGLPSVSTESSREANPGSNLSSSPRSEMEPNADGEDLRPPKLVKWPSSLYRSVSAIRNDVLEAEAKESE